MSCAQLMRMEGWRLFYQMHGCSRYCCTTYSFQMWYSAFCACSQGCEARPYQYHTAVAPYSCSTLQP